MNTNGQLLELLTRSDMFHDYQRAYTEATGRPLTLRPVETWQLALHGKRGESSFCAVIAGQSRSCAACLRLQDRLAQAATDRPATITCAYGLCETAVPVKLGTQTIGFLQTGQVMRQPPNWALFRKAVEKAGEFGVNLDHPEAQAAYWATPVAPPKRIEAMTDMLTIFADHLAMKSNQLAVQAANAELPIITRAKQFIREHHRDDLSLGQVAAVVHSSTFYFCKLFSRSTGTTFTEFVSRTRIEKAKNLLLNHNLRISEIAFEAGFQSLTHFNRVFKNLVGESPSGYRRNLPLAGTHR